MNDLYNNPIGHWIVVTAAITALLFVVLTATAYTVWFERVALGRIQRRPGPNRVGPFGLLQLAADGVQCEVIDLRTTSPLDEDTVLESVEGTGRLVVVDEAHPRCNIATDISALVARKAFGALQAPIEMVTAPHTPVPFSSALEDIYIPDAQRVVNAVKTVTGWTR